MTSQWFPNDPLLRKWAEGLVQDPDLFQSDEYRHSLWAAPGVTLEAHLTDEAVSLLGDVLHAHGTVAIGPALIATLTRKTDDPVPMAVEAINLVRCAYQLQLYADLDDGACRRHEAAKAELWGIVQIRLQRGSFYRTGVPGFHALVERAAELGIERDDLFNELWGKIWPGIVRGPNPASDPRKMYGFIQSQANGFISHTMQRLNRELNRRAREARAEPDDDHAPEYPGARTVGAMAGRDPTADEAIERAMLDHYVGEILEIYTAASRQNRLGYLIFLFRTLALPEMTGVPPHLTGKNQKIAWALETWRTDPARLHTYLEDPVYGLGLGAEVAARIAGAIGSAFDDAPHPITEDFVTLLLNRFNTAMKPLLATYFHASGEQPPSSDATAGDTGEEAADG